MDEQNCWKEVFRRMQAGGRGRLVLPAALLVGGLLLMGLPSSKVPPRAVPPAETQQLTDYEQALEARLTALLSQVEGAGRVQVMVTLVSTPLHVYATDVRESMGGTEQSHILLEGGNALTETVETPEIGGAAILCEGGDDARVTAQIYEIVSSLLGLSTGRISVAKLS